MTRKKTTKKAAAKKPATQPANPEPAPLSPEEEARQRRDAFLAYIKEGEEAFRCVIAANLTSEPVGKFPEGKALVGAVWDVYPMAVE